MATKKEDEPSFIAANLIFWAITFGIVLSSLLLDGWQMVLVWFALYGIGWIIKRKWGS